MKKEIKNQKKKIIFEKRNSKQAILDIHHEEGVAKVPIPGIDQVIEAKEW
ncbi:MAG: CDIF630_02480 family spore surface protein, partial [Senegalia sp. (in: firmicutes)]